MACAGEEIGIAFDAGQGLQNAQGGVRKGNPMFFRSAGMVQTAASRSISFHWACRTSLVRVAVRIRNRNASADTLLLPDSYAMKAGTSV